MASSTLNIFGQSTYGGSVNTVVGSYLAGCEPWSYNGVNGPNADGNSATAMQIYNPEGIASDGTNMFITDYNNSCIWKVTSSGVASRVVGTCTAVPGSSTDGTGLSAGTASTRYPMGIAMDPQNSGNFYFVDMVDQNSGKLRYVNFLNTTVTIGGGTVAAATGGVPQVKTIASYSPYAVAPYSGISRLTGVAAFSSSQICFASGYVSNTFTGGNQGGHNVTCLNPSTGALTKKIGPSEISISIRGGEPLGSEQEGIDSSSAILNGPYGLSFDGSGNIYISERLNQAIRMVRRWW
jgi:hypothetical protein